MNHGARADSRFNVVVNALIGLWVTAFVAIFVGARLASWMRPVGHTMVATGFLLAAALLALRGSGRLGWYPRYLLVASAVGAVSAATFATLYSLDFVIGVPRSDQAIVLIGLTTSGLVFAGTLVPDLLRKEN